MTSNERVTVTIEELVAKGISEERAKEVIAAVEKTQKDTEQLERELAETPYETEEINKTIAKWQKSNPNDVEILPDGSLAFFDRQTGIKVRHKRKDLLTTMLVNNKCISGIIRNFESNIPDYYPAPEYYQPIVDENNQVTVIVPRGQLKSNLDFGLSYNDAVRLIKMLNKRNPDKEFFLENM